MVLLVIRGMLAAAVAGVATRRRPDGRRIVRRKRGGADGNGHAWGRPEHGHGKRERAGAGRRSRSTSRRRSADRRVRQGGAARHARSAARPDRQPKRPAEPTYRAVQLESATASFARRCRARLRPRSARLRASARSGTRGRKDAAGRAQRRPLLRRRPTRPACASRCCRRAEPRPGEARRGCVQRQAQRRGRPGEERGFRREGDGRREREELPGGSRPGEPVAGRRECHRGAERNRLPISGRSGAAGRRQHEHQCLEQLEQSPDRGRARRSRRSTRREQQLHNDQDDLKSAKSDVKKYQAKVDSLQNQVDAQQAKVDADKAALDACNANPPAGGCSSLQARTRTISRR